MSKASRKQSKRKRWILIGALALLLAAGFLLGPNLLGRIRGSRAAEQAPANNVVSVARGDLSAKVAASGQVKAQQVTRLAAKIPGLVTAVHVQVGEQVHAGDMLVELKIDDLALQVARAEQNLALSQAKLEALQRAPREADVAAAQAAVQSALVNLDELLAAPTEQDIAESEANLRAQEANVASALAAYTSTLEAISDSAIAAAEADLLAAQIAYEDAKKLSDERPSGSTYEAFLEAAEDLDIARTALQELRAGPHPGRLKSAQAGIEAAQAALDQARANHERLLSGASAAQIAAAQANLEQMQANLYNLTKGPSDQTLEAAEAEVEQARLNLDDAQEALDDATIKAPFEGVVSDVLVTSGEYAAGEVAKLLSSHLSVMLSVDEIDIGALAVGQPALVTMEAWPKTEIPAEIVDIAPNAETGADGIVSFDVRLELQATDLPILEGMTANAQLITAHHENVLLVPNAAITANRQAGTYSVNRVNGKKEDGSLIIERVQVNIGIRDGKWTEITSGLSEGEQVLIGELQTPTRRYGPFGGS